MRTNFMRTVALSGILLCFSGFFLADNKEIFDLTAYSQNVDDFISPQDPGYDQSLIDPQMQAARREELLDRLFGGLSPWSPTYVQSILDRQPPDDVFSWETYLLQKYSNKDKPAPQIGYGSNFRPYPGPWIEALADAMNLSQLQDHRVFNPNRRAIAVNNLACRLLPTDDVHFYSYTLAGEGYPFDNLQNSAVWAGTPVYVLGLTRDGRWSLIVTPDFMGWVKSEGLARTDEFFVWNWRRLARRNLVAVVQSDTAVRAKTGQALLSAFVGTLFPAIGDAPRPTQEWEVLTPARDEAGRAFTLAARIPAERAAKVPLAATPRNISRLIKALLGRPYGWGNMYLYNDCSAEMKALFAPLGVYLPRNSAAQPSAGRQVNLSAKTLPERLAFLLEQGKPLRTIFFIGGHIILYLGPTTVGGVDYPMSFQNIWGLAPADRSKRSILGGSVLLPILDVYPEDPTLQSLAAKSFFIVSFLDEWPPASAPAPFVDLQSLILAPEREGE